MCFPQSHRFHPFCCLSAAPQSQPSQLSLKLSQSPLDAPPFTLSALGTQSLRCTWSVSRSHTFSWVPPCSATSGDSLSPHTANSNPPAPSLQGPLPPGTPPLPESLVCSFSATALPSSCTRDSLPLQERSSARLSHLLTQAVIGYLSFSSHWTCGKMGPQD